MLDHVDLEQIRRPELVIAEFALMLRVAHLMLGRIMSGE